EDYPTRIMFASDLVLTPGRNKTEEWVREQFTAYLDMLSKETYTTTAIPGETLKGLALPGYLLERVLYKNYNDFIAKQPTDTQITRKIDWKRMNVVPTNRKPGEAFPPAPQKGKSGGL
ncbi:MAG: Amidohydro-rel protein, partial [Candidatus Hydrogenedentes bacterium]|nr:Amidohydro-rel protein [Candidatus Hydrogenedentota bacterium]